MNKKFTLLSLAAVAAITLQAGHYVTSGNGTGYTFTTLATVAGSGVTQKGDTVTVSDSVTIADGDRFSLEAGKVVVLGSGAYLHFLGQTDLTAQGDSTVFMAAEGATPVSIDIAKSGSTTTVRNVRFHEIGLRTLGANLVVDSCYFDYYNDANNSHAVIKLAADGARLSLTNSTFYRNSYSVVNGAANLLNPVTIENCQLIENGTSGRLYPQINITVADTVIIRNNIIRGDSTYEKVGGIAVSNLYGLSGNFFTLIADNIVENNSYGATTAGSQSAVFSGNTFTNNTRITNAMMGGSGVSISSTGKANSIVLTDNKISGNYWGVTVIGHNNVNLGKVSDPSAADYNPGGNEFSNNGNGGKLYDVALSSNAGDTIWAQGNKWNVSDQTDSAAIENVILHSNDNSILGTVIFMPTAAITNGIASVDANKENGSVEIFDINGRRMSSDPRSLVPGIYIFREKGTVTKRLVK